MTFVESFKVCVERSHSAILFTISSVAKDLTVCKSVPLADHHGDFWESVILAMDSQVVEFCAALEITPSRVWRKLASIVRNNHADDFQQLPWRDN